MHKSGVAFALLASCLAMTACQLEVTSMKVIAVATACRLVDAKGVELRDVTLANDDLVKWQNQTGSVIKIVVTDSKVLGGRRSLRLEPAEFVVIRVGRSAGSSLLLWYCGGASDDDDGGAGQVPVNTGGGGNG